MRLDLLFVSVNFFIFSFRARRARMNLPSVYNIFRKFAFDCSLFFHSFVYFCCCCVSLFFFSAVRYCLFLIFKHKNDYYNDDSDNTRYSSDHDDDDEDNSDQLILSQYTHTKQISKSSTYQTACNPVRSINLVVCICAMQF